ncbi:MAG: hypothetical protein KME20_21405 [Kaiparowitsia implicata GSE-PSE-MK54-09C]|jgi:hypothetical protein|nr:hypothetical protein [Kaiparowitsia implicata GSE-PSE-MK54-09C]
MDTVGNTFPTAKRIQLTPQPQAFMARVGNGDPRDIYRFKLNRSRNLSLVMKKLTANADLELLNHTKEVVRRSARNGTRKEVIRADLEPGVYFIRIFPRTPQDATRYRLVASARAASEPPSPFSIELDYRFDTGGWFTPVRRAAMRFAANLWERLIQTDFPVVAQGTLTPNVINPQTGQQVDFVTDSPIDDIKVFVGARNLRGTFGSTLARSGPSGFFTNEIRYAGSTFQPWIGTITFDNSTRTNWFFDATPNTADDIPTSAQDFISIAVHEIGHVLGFGTSRAFSRLVQNGTFTGANARLQNGGNALPLADSAHFPNGGQFPGSGEALMTPFSNLGTRKLPTAVDLAVLQDLGYAVNYQRASINPPSSVGGSSAPVSRSEPTVLSPPYYTEIGSGAPYATCGCLSCLAA